MSQHTIHQYPNANSTNSLIAIFELENPINKKNQQTFTKEPNNKLNPLQKQSKLKMKLKWTQQYIHIFHSRPFTTTPILNSNNKLIYKNKK
jgi:hypothetical protein